MNLFLKNLLSAVVAAVVAITARFNKDVSKLEKLSLDHRAAAESHTDLAHDFLDMAEAAHAEADRAARVAARVKALID
jgi:outer membrane murein-binding lipoprotein Lpp